MRKTRNIMNKVNAILLKITKKKFCWKNHALKGRNRELTKRPPAFHTKALRYMTVGTTFPYHKKSNGKGSCEPQPTFHLRAVDILYVLGDLHCIYSAFTLHFPSVKKNFVSLHELCRTALCIVLVNLSRLREFVGHLAYESFPLQGICFKSLDFLLINFSCCRGFV